MSFFTSSVAPGRISTDEIIALHVWDDSPLYRRIALYNLKVFDDVLDPEKLRGSLETLVSERTWRKLGGRLRKKDDGYLEYHIPAQFTKDRPAIAFTHVNLTTITKDDHPIASRLPKPSSHPSIVGDPEETVSLACGPDCPTSIDEYLYTDRPSLGLHVVSFKDATLVTLHWLHIACDALGMKGLVDGWVCAMKGLPIPEQQGYDYDPLKELGRHPKEEHKLAHERMGAVSLMKYAAWNGYSLALGKKETRMVCIPGWFLKRLHVTALEELVAAGVKDPYLTENDVLVAWWTRIALSHLPPDSDRPVTIQIGMSLRKSLSKDLLDPDKPFVSNCFGFTNLLLPASTIKHNPTSKTALQLRTTLNEQRTREQVEAYQAMVLDSIAPLPVFFGNGNTYQISYTNWTKAGLFQADFSAAAVKERSEALYASYIGHCQIPFKFPEGFVVVGKDVKDNTWLCAYRVAGLWERVEKELEVLRDLEEATLHGVINNAMG